jgi:serine/threonine protein kinase
MSGKSAEEQRLFLEQVAANDPEMAAHLSLEVSKGVADSELPDTLPLGINIALPERFHLIRYLGRGGFGTVYQVHDSQGHHDVALKILRDPDPDTLFRFKQEFRSLATLKHPHLIQFYELFEYRHVWFFTMELVSGTSFLRHVRGGGRWDLGRLRSALRDLADALAYLHANKLVHRDIKPSNVLIDGSGRLVLLDFGLATRPSGDAQSATFSVGTPAYMAPEQTSSGASVDGAADWYAVGAMLYEALTGQLPFRGSIVDVLAAKASSDPVPPSSISPDIPAAWNEALPASAEARAAFAAGCAERPGMAGR